MPELPEVQTTVDGLKPHVQAQIVHEVVFYRPNIRYPLDNAWPAAIRGRQITGVERRAKLIIMPLDKGCLLWHLGMTGSLRICGAQEAKRKHDHVELQLANGRLLRFHDPRRFGYLKWFADKAALLASIAHYGVEPLSAEFSTDFLYRRSRDKRQAVKNFIMDQAVVVGVGNIYACEALFIAGIRPQTPSVRISAKRYQRLVAGIKSVLQQAINQGGTTLKDFENAEAQPGYFQQSLAVYGRTGEPCLHCQTAIVAIKLAGRNSFYCPRCQR